MAPQYSGGRPRAPGLVIDGAIALTLAGAAWALYGSIRDLWWTHDDFFHLRTLVTGRPFWYLFDAPAYRELPGRVLTPLLFLSLDLDRRLFGLEPRFFYVHHLAALAGCAAALYGVARLWLSRPWAGLAAWIFLIGPVTGSLASMLMVRQYVEAIALSALSVLAWALALRQWPGRRAWVLAGLSAALYAAASLAKEIAVPLWLVLPLLPAPVPLRERARLAVPHVLLFVAYLALRQAMLGTLSGGYGFAVPPADVPRLALELPGKIAAHLVGGDDHQSTAAVVCGLALVTGLAGLVVPPIDGRAVRLVGLALLLALLPVLPVSTRLEPRYAAAAWVVVAVAFAAGCGRWWAAPSAPGTRRALAVVIAVVASVAGVWLHREDWRARHAGVERMSVENRFVLDMREGDVLSRPLTLAASLGELAWMKAAVYGRPPGGRWFQDDLFLCRQPEALGRVWGYDAGARRVADITGQIAARRDRYCASIRAEARLTASFRVAGTNLFWDLGPYGDGRYRFVFGDGRAVFDVPRRAGFQVRGQDAVTLRVGYDSPEGWTTYSPALELRVADGRSLSWSR